MTPDPIIMTLQLDPVASAFFERQRRTYFPEKLNKIPAHLTLFHQLPGEDPERILSLVAQVLPEPPFTVSVSGVMALGRGTAYRITSPRLEGLRARLAAHFAPSLTRQDREAFRPHVTVQNKVTVEVARATMAALADDFAPFDATAEGLQLWFYRGGPWAPLAAVPFEGEQAPLKR